VALTEAQKARVRAYLGWERGFELNSKLESKLLALTAEEEALVIGVLNALAEVDAAIDALVVERRAGVVAVDEIRFSDADPFEMYRAQGRRYVARLSAILGVDSNRDYYGDGSVAIAVPIPLG